MTLVYVYAYNSGSVMIFIVIFTRSILEYINEVVFIIDCRNTCNRRSGHRVQCPSFSPEQTDHQELPVERR